MFAGLVTTLMQMAYLKLVGGVLLLWIAVKLLGPEENGKSDEVEPVDTLWRAIRIVAIADLVMSLDNVIAIAAVAERFEAPQSYALLMFGLAVSIPLIMAGAALIMARARALSRSWCGRAPRCSAGSPARSSPRTRCSPPISIPPRRIRYG